MEGITASFVPYQTFYIYHICTYIVHKHSSSASLLLIFRIPNSIAHTPFLFSFTTRKNNEENILFWGIYNYYHEKWEWDICNYYIRIYAYIFLIGMRINFKFHILLFSFISSHKCLVFWLWFPMTLYHIHFLSRQSDCLQGYATEDEGVKITCKIGSDGEPRIPMNRCLFPSRILSHKFGNELYLIEWNRMHWESLLFFLSPIWGISLD